MQKSKRFTLGFLAVLMTALMLQVSTAQAKHTKVKVIAAVFHADWCSYCKQMGPSVMKTMDSYKADKAVKFVEFDLTDEATKRQSAKLAARNGLTPIWKANQKTGMVLLVDAKTHRVMGTIVSTDSQSEMTRKIEAAKG